MESKGLMAPYQYGFRPGRSTLDALFRLETDVRKALAMKEVLVAVHFDIEKAYNIMWREGLLLKLQRMGIEVRFYNWCKDERT